MRYIILPDVNDKGSSLLENIRIVHKHQLHCCHSNIMNTGLTFVSALLTLKVLVTTIDALGHF